MQASTSIYATKPHRWIHPELVLANYAVPFPGCRFTTNHLMRDPRFKVQLALNEAGIRNPALRQMAVATAAPFRPRPDNLTTAQKGVPFHMAVMGPAGGTV